MPLHGAIQKALLDWVTGAAAASAPAGQWVSFATASPRSDSAFDGPWSPRASVTFAGANSPAGSVTNLSSVRAVTATAAGTAVGWNLWDAAVAGNRIAFGTCTAAIGCKSGDNIVISAGLFKITLT